MSTERRARPDPCDWPEYCCAILRDADGRYLLEKRPEHETDAPGRLICFGGGREPGEHPDACVRRELIEELGLRMGDLERCVSLVQAQRVIAWFYRGVIDPSKARAMERDVGTVWAAWDEFPGLPVGAWHLAAMAAERRCEPVARV